MTVGHAVQKMLLTSGFGLVVAALVVGLMPVTIGDTSYGGEGFKCGSAFFVNDDLTDYGHETCEVVGGRASDRAWALGMLVMGLVLLLGAITTDVSGTRRQAVVPPQFSPPTF